MCGSLWYRRVKALSGHNSHLFGAKTSAKCLSHVLSLLVQPDKGPFSYATGYTRALLPQVLSPSLPRSLPSLRSEQASSLFQGITHTSGWRVSPSLFPLPVPSIGGDGGVPVPRRVRGAGRKDAGVIPFLFVTVWCFALFCFFICFSLITP